MGIQSNGNIAWAWNDRSDSGSATAGEYRCNSENFNGDDGACLANGDDPFLTVVSGAAGAPLSVPAVSPGALVPLAILPASIPLLAWRRMRLRRVAGAKADWQQPTAKSI
jgi:hypothetical protein